MHEIKLLTTDRLSLRAFEKDDWPAMHEIVADPDVSRYMPFEPLTEEQTRDSMQWMIDGPSHDPPRYHFAVVLRAEMYLIGACAMAIKTDELRQGELWYLMNRRYWGHGYATEAARAVLAYGFVELELHRVYATSRPANVASIRVLEKLGMRREGHLWEHRWMKGRWHDSFLYAILDREWHEQDRGKRAMGDG